MIYRAPRVNEIAPALLFGLTAVLLGGVGCGILPVGWLFDAGVL